MGGKRFFFAGGGTGGHIYPGIAVAERVVELQPTAKIHFFCSKRDIDTQILKQVGFGYTQLPAKGLSFRPGKLIRFCTSFSKSYRIAKGTITGGEDAAVIGIGGFVAAPVCRAAHRLGIRVVLINLDIVPGRANKMAARWADEVFVQFAEAAEYFGKKTAKVDVVGCPLRAGFEHPEPDKAVEQLGLDRNKKILLITGASSGSENINDAVCSLLAKLDSLAGDWQIVHLTGLRNYEKVRQAYADAKIAHRVSGYFDDMPNLLGAADLVVGRSGAVSVAEYAAAGVPSICVPYPYHRDRHQYLNAGKLVKAGAAVIVDDLPYAKERAEWLWEELESLMKDEKKRQEMKKNCETVANKDASVKIARALLEMSR